MNQDMPGLGGKAMIGPEEKMLLVLSGNLEPELMSADMRFTAKGSSKILTSPSALNVTSY